MLADLLLHEGASLLCRQAMSGMPTPCPGCKCKGNVPSTVPATFTKAPVRRLIGDSEATNAPLVISQDRTSKHYSTLFQAPRSSSDGPAPSGSTGSPCPLPCWPAGPGGRSTHVPATTVPSPGHGFSWLNAAISLGQAP